MLGLPGIGLLPEHLKGSLVALGFFKLAPRESHTQTLSVPLSIINYMPLVHTCNTTTPSRTSVVGILWGKLMAMFTVDFCTLSSSCNFSGFTSANIFLLSYSFQMVRINTMPSSTQMIQLKTLWDFPDPMPISHPMSKLYSLVIPKTSIAFRKSQLP